MDEQREFLQQIVERLDSAGIPYMVTGSMAMAFYTEPRMTRDIDLVVVYTPEDANRIVALFERDCYIDAGSVRDAAVRRSMFNIVHNEMIIKTDFIVRKEGPFRELEFERRRVVDMEGFPVAVATPEDLILSKLHWARDSESELQQRDVRKLVESVADLDWPYLRKWAGELGVEHLLDRVERR